MSIEKTDSKPRLTTPLIVYATQWCGDCVRAKRVLDQYGVPYQWIDVDEDQDSMRVVERLNRGYHSVPTIIFPDGSHLTEPSSRELTEKLGLTP